MILLGWRISFKDMTGKFQDFHSSYISKHQHFRMWLIRQNLGHATKYEIRDSRLWYLHSGTNKVFFHEVVSSSTQVWCVKYKRTLRHVILSKQFKNTDVQIANHFGWTINFYTFKLNIRKPNYDLKNTGINSDFVNWKKYYLIGILKDNY